MPLDDTHIEARAVQAEILRRMTPAQRFAMLERMTGDTTRWSREGLREVMPGAREQDVILRWIEIVYGRDIANRVRPFRHRLGVEP